MFAPEISLINFYDLLNEDKINGLAEKREQQGLKGKNRWISPGTVFYAGILQAYRVLSHTKYLWSIGQLFPWGN